MLYQIQNPIDKAMGGMNQAAGTYGGMMRANPTASKPGPTVGGGIMAGYGGAMAGAQAGSMISSSNNAGSWGAGIGAVVGIGSYLLS